MPRVFTADEANAALEELRPLAERMVAHRRELADAQIRQTQLVTRIAGNGGDLSPGEVRDAREDMAHAADGIAECVRKITEAGVQVKDLDEGLLDFPARRGDEDVLLCWRVGEPEVAFWHGLEEGFAVNARGPSPRAPTKGGRSVLSRGRWRYASPPASVRPAVRAAALALTSGLGRGRGAFGGQHDRLPAPDDCRPNETL